jgi:hypothetical protein
VVVVVAAAARRAQGLIDAYRSIVGKGHFGHLQIEFGKIRSTELARILRCYAGCCKRAEEDEMDPGRDRLGHPPSLPLFVLLFASGRLSGAPSGRRTRPGGGLPVRP